MPRQRSALAGGLNAKYENIMVDRGYGTGRMVTHAVTQEIYPSTRYRLSQGSLVQVPSCGASVTQPLPRPPPRVRVAGVWSTQADPGARDSSNILGGYGNFRASVDHLIIPASVATAAGLAYYGARLVEEGSEFEMQSPRPMPLTDMTVGPTYVRD